MSDDVTLTINEGTLLLVAEILRAERGEEKRSGKDAAEAIRAALRNLR